MTTETETVAAQAASEPKPASTVDVKPVTAETSETEDAAPSADTPDGSNPEDTPAEPKPDGGVQKKINKLTARASSASPGLSSALKKACAPVSWAIRC